MRRSVYILFALAMAAGFLAGAPLSAEPEHPSIMVIDASEPLPVKRRVSIGLNKSMLVELPRELRDVIVSNPKMLDAVAQTSNRASLIGMAPGEANVFFFDRSGQQILTLEVNIERDLTALRDLMTRLLPGSNIRLDAVNDNIVLTGTVVNAADAVRAAEVASKFVADKEHVVNMISAESREQVMLKVSVVEMNRNIIKQLGINWDGNIGIGSNVLGLGSNPPSAFNNALPNIINPLIPKSVDNLGQQNGLFANGAPLGFGPNPGGNGIGLTDGKTIVNLRALEQDGLLHTLAEPNLTAVSGETASFLAGGEFPIPINDDDGDITVEFKKFGVGLNFTPVVMSEGRISLKISTEVSELSNEGAVRVASITIPALKVRRAETVVELPSGGSLAMAGLLSDNTKNAVNGLPGLKNLPILGTLFRSRDYIKNETELVVIVTPYVVKAVARDQLVRPDKGFAQPTDEQAYLFGRLNRIYGRDPEHDIAGSLKDTGHKGNYGFIVD